METGSKETVLKPDRTPDAVIKPGHAVWWREMVYMHVFGSVFKMEVDQEDGSLIVWGHGGIKGKLSKETKDLYDAYWYESFEDAFLGEENE